MTRLAWIALVAAVAGCGGAAPLPPVDPVRQEAAVRPAVQALQAGDFAAARAASVRALAEDRRNAVAAAVHALASYQAAGERLRDELTAVLESADAARRFDHARARTAWTAFERELAAVDADLAIAAADPDFALELCLACWAHDWNHSGDVDDGDRKLFQIELDDHGVELPEGDPRRTPTFRFDAGDVTWARAMVAFQRALAEWVLGYKWDELDRVITSDLRRPMTIEVDDVGRIRRARELIRAGLAFSDRSRAQYLAETDDDREWVPNPRQHDHAVPLVMNEAMYDTWGQVTRDLRALVDGTEGLDLVEVFGVRANITGFLDVGRLLDQPQDITLDFRDLGNDVLRRTIHGVFGSAIVDRMARSPLVARVLRMARELDNDEDTLGRKLRYFLWIN